MSASDADILIDILILHLCTVCFRQRSFHSSAPTVSNDLPSELKDSDLSRQCFKCRLKLRLFEHVHKAMSAMGFGWEALDKMCLLSC